LCFEGGIMFLNVIVTIIVRYIPLTLQVGVVFKLKLIKN